MDVKPIDAPAALRGLWRNARNRGWTRGHVVLIVGWATEDRRQRRALEKLVIREGAWHAAPEEEYEPECDPLDFVAFTVMKRPSLSDLETRLDHVQELVRGSSAVLIRLGIGTAE